MGVFKAMVSIQTIHNTKYYWPLMDELINKKINVVQKIVSDVFINSVKIDDDLLSAITLRSKERRTTIRMKASDIMILALGSNTFCNVTKELLSDYIDELFIDNIRRMQGINDDAIWLELDEDVELKLSSPKVGRLLKDIKNPDKLIFFFEGRPQWNGSDVS
jgi:hypothetical protein